VVSLLRKRRALDKEIEDVRGGKRVMYSSHRLGENELESDDDE